MIRLLVSFVAIVSLITGANPLYAQEEVDTHWNADPKDDVFKIGMFDEPAGVKTPTGWQDLSAFGSGNATLEAGGRGILRMKLLPGDTNTFIETQIEVPANAKYLTLMVKLRGPTLERNSERDSGAGVRFSLLKGDTERRLKRVEPGYEGYRNWSFPIHTMQVMPGEDRLRIRVEVTNATGDLEIDNIFVVPSDIAKEPTKEQQRQLNQAFDKDDPELIRKLVEAAPHLLEIRTGQYDNGTPLIRAAWVGAPKVAATLLKLGADIEAKDSNWGNTPLRWCCWWGVPDVAEVLMEAGAQANGAAAMARSSKTNNPFTKRTPEEFDRTVKIIEDQLAKRDAQK